MEISLLKKLITIPSWLDKTKGIDEKEIGYFIFKFLKSNCPWLSIKKQYLNNGTRRYNIIVCDKYKPRIVFVCHMDTVKPTGKIKKLLKSTVKDDKLFGLGAADMKGGIAALLTALIEIGPTKGVAVIFDCDEEYYFQGIKKILEEYCFKPDLVICPEPTNLKVINGCRGLIELSFDVIGKTAKAATPDLGKNAIQNAVYIVDELRLIFRKYRSKYLQETSINLAYLNGGIDLNGTVKIQPNMVPNLAKVILDIRPSDRTIDARYVFKLIDKIASTLGVKVVNKKTAVDYKPYLVSQIKLNLVKDLKFESNLAQLGFQESALISQAWNVPAISFGPTGIGHSENEFVNINSLKTVKEKFKELINSCR